MKTLLLLLLSIQAMANIGPFPGGGGGGTSGGGGTVTSVGLAEGSTTPIYTISNSPVTTSGTLTFSLKSVTANLLFAGPSSGGNAQPSFRSFVAGDLASAIVPVANGGTGLGTLTANNVLLGNGTSNVAFVAPGTSGNLLTSNGTTWISNTASASGANTALSNLASVAINTSLLPGVDNSIDLGSSSFRFKNLLAGTGFTVSTLNYSGITLNQAIAASGTSLVVSAGRSSGGNGGDLNLFAARGNGAPAINDGFIKIIEGDGSTYAYFDLNNGKLIFSAPALVASGQRGIVFNLNTAGTHTASIVPDSDSLEFVAFSGFEFLPGGGAGTVNITSTGSVDIATIGQGLNVAEGTNARQGVATLSAGTAVVSTTKVAANSRIFLTCQDPNGGTPGFQYVSARTASTSFTITSIATDTCIVAWEIINPG